MTAQSYVAARADNTMRWYNAPSFLFRHAGSSSSKDRINRSSRSIERGKIKGKELAVGLSVAQKHKRTTTTTTLLLCMVYSAVCLPADRNDVANGS